MSFANIGQLWTPKQFRDYLRTQERPQWVKAITLHHTAAPSLAMRPNGLTIQHIKNIMSGYKEKGWNSGPHLFVDDSNTRCVLGMTPLQEKGIHATSFNRDSIGIEVLGDYDNESPFDGRGLNAWKNAAECTKALLTWLSLPKAAIRFHREDPRTDKTCPGELVKKDWFLAML